MEIHGGTIKADSPPEGASVGSEFAVRLGLVPAPALRVAEAPQGTAGSRTDSKGIRVLVVDDNSDHVLMLTASLREKGYSVQAAYSGTDGLKTAQQWRPDIVLLDIGLPGLDGYEVAKRIRSGPELDLRKARLIALSGYGRDTDIALARESGFDAHLTKPFDFGELVKLMVLPARRR
jgi:CheY-like chemotaxis protein